MALLCIASENGTAVSGDERVTPPSLELHSLQTLRKNPWNLSRTPVRPFAFGPHRSIGRLRLSEPNPSEISLVDLCQYPTTMNISSNSVTSCNIPTCG